ncbi:UNVERIFIED_CONTAM: hypothetical protein Scaly_2250700 [Sesamum calycinum]|uniref:Uncharacterized protein n=1 Tax=Sesamum calycinum TaxID=2727403 RepID=A0AAW2MDG4_9LAMI
MVTCCTGRTTLIWTTASFRYKPTRERNSKRKKILYAILRYSSLTPFLQRLCALAATTKQTTWHANHQMDEGSMCYPSDTKAWRHFDRTYSDFAAKPIVLDWVCTDGFEPHG